MWSLSVLQFCLFQLLLCDDHLTESLLLVCHHPVLGISHNSLHKYHSLRIASFGSLGQFYFLLLFVKHMVAWICCVFHGTHKGYSAYKSLKYVLFVFVFFLKTRCLWFASFCAVKVCLLWVTIAFEFKFCFFFCESQQVEERCTPNMYLFFLVAFLGTQLFLSIAIMSYVMSKERSKLIAFSLSRLKQQW